MEGRWYNTEHYYSRIGYVTPEQMHPDLAGGVIAEKKEYWGSNGNFVKCTGQQIKQPEASCSLLEIRFYWSANQTTGSEL